MKHILIILTLVIMGRTSTAQIAQATDSCTGMVTISNFYMVDAIPLYTQPNSVPFDVLKFKQKRIGWHKYYAVQSNLGERFAPYELVHGNQSALIAESNRSIMNSKNNWVRTHLHSQQAYKLSFKLIGKYDEWLKVELNSKTRETCYIHRNDSYMSFSSWEDIIASAQCVSFIKQPIYNKPNGNKIAATDEWVSVSVIAIAGEWMHINYHNGADNDGCWIKWKDESGMLVTDLIYEFIR